MWFQNYFIKYKLYDINNVIHFETFSQYQNWLTAMEKNFEKFFEVTEVHTSDVYSRGQKPSDYVNCGPGGIVN